MTQIDGLMSRAEVKDFFGIGETTLCSWLKRGWLPIPLRFGRATYWFRDSLDLTLSILKNKSEQGLRRK